MNDTPQSLDFKMEWLSELLKGLEQHCSQAQCAALMHQCAACHYKSKDMDALITRYTGDLPGFIEHASREWGQIVTWNKEENTLLVDENKNFCVCPITQSLGPEKTSPVLCHCSEGFTAKVISTIVGRKVESRVLRSVLRGDASCVYEIIL